MKLLAIFLALFLLAALLASAFLSRPIFDERFDSPPARALSAAPIDRALTFARTLDGRVVLVVSADDEGVRAIDLNQGSSQRYEDALEPFNRLGADHLRRMAENSPMVLRIPWSELGAPLAGAGQSIAAGTNFRAHAQEVGHDGEPFLFPKLSSPTPWNAAVKTVGRLDYEVELCAVPMADVEAGANPPLGYLLCNDFTDRWALVRDIDLDGPMGLTGFALAKGGDTHLPVGPLLVVPASDDFHESIELSLYVDDALRQRAPASAMIWTPREILSQALRQCRNAYDLAGESIALGSCRRIDAGTLILTGTPEGVMFSPATIWAPWAYLRPGQRVSSYATFLGALDNTIVAN